MPARGATTSLPIRPGGDDSFELEDYAAAVIGAVAERTGLVVVAASFSGFTSRPG